MKPFYERDNATLYHGDCREILPLLDPADCLIADPPYGDTSLVWDKPIDGWMDAIRLTSVGSLWLFGSLRSFLRLDLRGWNVAQELVWEKHNGTSFLADRFRRVHELILQLYPEGCPWSDVFKSPVYTNDATKRTIRVKTRPPHLGHIDSTPHQSEDGGPRLMRSVIYAANAHGYAVHPTQKPTSIIAPLIEYSCPSDGTVIDPCCGSGTTLVAARMLGRRSIGIEREERYCEAAANRLRQQPLDLAIATTAPRTTPETAKGDWANG